MIRTISISKISKPIIPDIEQIDQTTDNSPKNTTETKFECTLKLYKIKNSFVKWKWNNSRLIAKKW